MSNTGTRVQQRLLRNFLLQGVLIALAAALGIVATNWLLSDVLVKEALVNEGEHYWQLLASDPNAPLANTLNMRGFLLPRDQAALSSVLPDYELGYHLTDAEQFGAYLATRKDDQTLVLLFNRAGVDGLIAFYGIAPLILVLALLYAATYIGYRFAQRAVSPVVALAKQVQALDPVNPDGSAFDPTKLPRGTDSEIATLAGAFHDFIRRIGGFVARERVFTRDASHELRTPITVINMAADLLRADTTLNPNAASLVDRIYRASMDMEELTSAFLALAREESNRGALNEVNVNLIVADELQKAQPLLENKPVNVELIADNYIQVRGNEKVLSILVGNLLRNAIKYTDEGRVLVRLQADTLTIADTGRGIAKEKLAKVFEPYVRDADNQRSGYGVGLSIVKRLCDQFGWQLHLQSEKGAGTTIKIVFVGAKVIPQDAA